MVGRGLGLARARPGRVRVRLPGAAAPHLERRAPRSASRSSSSRGGCEEAGLDAVANFSKLAAATLLGFWFIRLFETVGLVVFVACLIPWIDAYSVWRGPTSNIVSNHAAGLHVGLVRAPHPRRERRGAARPAGHPLLRALPRRRRPLRAACLLDLARARASRSARRSRSRSAGTSAACRRSRGLSIAFLAVNIDLLWPTFRRGWAAVTGGSRASP